VRAPSRFRYYLDKTTIYPVERWAAAAALLVLYGWRAWYLRGWYIVNYGLCIFYLNLFIGFLSPQVRARRRAGRAARALAAARARARARTRNSQRGAAAGRRPVWRRRRGAPAACQAPPPRRCGCAALRARARPRARVRQVPAPPHPPAPPLQTDPETDGPLLPTSGAEEFRPFNRKVPEFAFWWGVVRGVLTAFVMTFIPLFNIPVFWPVLVMYFFALLGLTLKDRIAHMVKHRYLPCSWGKRKYAKGAGKGAPGASAPAGAETLFKGGAPGQLSMAR